MQTGPGAWIQDIVYSPNGKILASCSGSTIDLWDVSTGLKIRSTTGGNGRTSYASLAFNPNGAELAAAIGDTIEIWNIRNGKLLTTLKGPPALESDGAVQAIAFSKKGLLASGSREKTITLWNLESKTSKILAKNLKSSVLVFSPDGSTLSVLADDKQIYLLTVSDGSKAILKGHRATVESVAFSPDGKTLASGGSDNNVKLWNLAVGKEFLTLRSGGDCMVTSVAFGPNNTLAFATQDQRIQVWDLDTIQKRYEIPSSETRPKNSYESYGYCTLSFQPIDGVLASAGEALKLWEGKTGKELFCLGNSAETRTDLAFRSDGKVMLAASNGRGTVKIWDVLESKNVLSVETPSNLGVGFANDDCTLLVTFNRDWRVSRNVEIKFWDLTSGAEIRTFVFDLHERFPSLSADGKKFAVVGHNSVDVWDVASGERCFEVPINFVENIKLSPDGKKLVALASDRKVLEHLVFIDLETKKRLRLGGSTWTPFKDFSINKDGSLVATAGDSINFWEPATGKQWVLGEHRNCNSVLFSKDGNLLISSSSEAGLKVWDVKAGRELYELENASGHVGKESLKPDSNIVCLRDEKLYKFWNYETKTELASLCAIDSNNWAVTTPEGRFDSGNLDDNSTFAWVVKEDPLRPLRPEMFLRDYFEPNILDRLLRGEALLPVKDISDLNRILPEVNLKVTPKPEKCDRVTIDVSCKSVIEEQPGNGRLASGVYDLCIFRDGQLIAHLPSNESFGSKSSRDLSHNSTKKFSYKFEAKLPYDGLAEHNFTAYAFNHHRVKSKTASFNYKMSKPLQRCIGRAYVIAFGVDIYDNPQWKLNYAAADARAFDDMLVPSLKSSGDYSNVTSIKLVSAEDKRDDELPATKECLRDVLLSLSGRKCSSQQTAKFLKKHGLCKSEPEDFILIAFACHGATDKKTGIYYLFPSNIGTKEISEFSPLLMKTGISSDELTDWLRDVDAEDLTMIIDACHSGAAPGKDFKPGPMDSPGLGQLAYYKRMRVLAASQATSAAQEKSTLQHGLLTFALLVEGLSKDGRADTAPTDKKIKLGEWLQFAKNEVPLLDSGNYKKRSIEDLLNKPRDFYLSGTSDRGRKIPQTPSLLDFSKRQDDSSILDLAK